MTDNGNWSQDYKLNNLENWPKHIVVELLKTLSLWYSSFVSNVNEIQIYEIENVKSVGTQNNAFSLISSRS